MKGVIVGRIGGGTADLYYILPSLSEIDYERLSQEDTDQHQSFTCLMDTLRGTTLTCCGLVEYSLTVISKPSRTPPAREVSTNVFPPERVGTCSSP